MIDDTNIAILAAVLAIVAAGDILAALFFLYLFLRSKREPEPGAEPGFIVRVLGWRSWLLAMMVGKSAIVALVFTYFGALVLRRLIGLPAADWTPPVSLALIILLGVIPIAFAVAFYLTRRASGMPPPFSDRD